MLVSTVLSLIVLPGVLRITLAGYRPVEEGDLEEDGSAPLAPHPAE
jgi:hypothetical protein